MSEIGDSSGSAPRSFTPEVIDLRPLPKRMPMWLKTGLAAACLGGAMIAWSLYGDPSPVHIETSILPPLSSDHAEAERKPAHGGELVHDLLARERARAKALEHQAT